MGKHANFIIIHNETDNPLVIKDIGPWDIHLSVTNDAEHVVEDLIKNGLLDNNRRLLCVDSECELGEFLIKDGKFAGYSCFIFGVKSDILKTLNYRVVES